jgi:hypothetical protein
MSTFYEIDNSYVLYSAYALRSTIRCGKYYPGGEPKTLIDRKSNHTSKCPLMETEGIYEMGLHLTTTYLSDVIIFTIFYDDTAHLDDEIVIGEFFNIKAFKKLENGTESFENIEYEIVGVLFRTIVTESLQHVTTICKRGNRWYEFNDSSVKPTKFPEFSQNIYTIFSRKCQKKRSK